MTKTREKTSGVYENIHVIKVSVVLIVIQWKLTAETFHGILIIIISISVFKFEFYDKFLVSNTENYCS